MRRREAALAASAAACIFAVVELAACGDVLAEPSPEDGGAGTGDATTGDVAITEDASSDAALVDALVRGDCGDDAGPVMVRVGAFCMDSTEVTVADYRAFITATLDGSVDAVAPLTQACATQTTFIPHGDWPRAAVEDPVPVTDVDWCDAWAYCRYVGKRLCNAKEWADTCSASGTRTYAYGNAYVAERCLVGKLRLQDNNPWPLDPVRYRPDCRDPSLPIYDLGGNAQEWTDNCLDDTPSGLCELRMPGSSDDVDAATCAATWNVPRDLSGGMLGIRCCSP